MHLMSVWQRELMHPSPSKTGANRKIGIFPTPLPSLFRIDSGFEFFGSGDLGHFYGVEHTAFYTGLAAVAEILVHFSLKAALFPHFSDIGLVCVNRVPDHATINTAVAHHRH